MSEGNNLQIQHLILIVDQKKKDSFLTLLYEYGAHGVDIVYGHGSMSPHAIMAAFGFEAEKHKVVISCLMKKEKVEELMKLLYTDYRFDKPNTGIAYSIPVEGLVF